MYISRTLISAFYGVTGLLVPPLDSSLSPLYRRELFTGSNLRSPGMSSSRHAFFTVTESFIYFEQIISPLLKCYPRTYRVSRCDQLTRKQRQQIKHMWHMSCRPQYTFAAASTTFNIPFAKNKNWDGSVGQKVRLRGTPCSIVNAIPIAPQSSVCARTFFDHSAIYASQHSIHRPVLLTPAATIRFSALCRTPRLKFESGNSSITVRRQERLHLRCWLINMSRFPQPRASFLSNCHPYMILSLCYY